jgi:hypothetical protein
MDGEGRSYQEHAIDDLMDEGGRSRLEQVIDDPTDGGGRSRLEQVIEGNAWRVAERRQPKPIVRSHIKLNHEGGVFFALPSYSG